MFRSILVALKPTVENGVVAKFAVKLATDMGWKLTAMSILDNERLAPSEPIPMGGAAFKIHRDTTLVEAARVDQERWLRELAIQSESALLAFESVAGEGDAVELLARGAEEVDLVVLGNRLASPAGDPLATTPLSALVHRLPRPALVVPSEWSESDGRGPVLVAYNGSLQSARALQCFAMSGLGVGKAISVVTIEEDVDLATNVGTRAVRYLKQHGLEAQPVFLPAEHGVTATLMRTVAETQASLLVMGAFGKSAVREYLFGSVTHTALSKARIPMLLTH